ncbi:MAG: redox-regulated ATPase YchF, partial [bacterium]|nr:redox-regulated ATPase YchF [bacterium]
ATVEYVDVPGMQKGKGSESLDLAQLRTVDALVHVVRAFEDPELVHVEGRVDPARDIETVDLELILADIEVVERRLARLAKAARGGLTRDQTSEQELLSERILPTLEGETPLRNIELGAEDEKRLRGFQLLSAMPMLVVLNVSEDRVADTVPAALGVPSLPHVEVLVVSAPIEEEISRLGPEEQREFLTELGLTEPSVDRVLRTSYKLLGLISFFTVGDDEVRAWTIRRGTGARDGGGAIHSDITRGFIRAEVVSSDDLLRLGSLNACRDHGLLRLEGKHYGLQDGDVADFRFNV